MVVSWSFGNSRQTEAQYFSLIKIINLPTMNYCLIYQYSSFEINISWRKFLLRQSSRQTKSPNMWSSRGSKRVEIWKARSFPSVAVLCLRWEFWQLHQTQTNCGENQVFPLRPSSLGIMRMERTGTWNVCRCYKQLFLQILQLLPTS